MIDTPARIAFLKKIHLFYGLKDDEFNLLAEELKEQTFPMGAVIFEQDAKPDAFYLIYKGNVKVVRRVERKSVQLATLVKNDYFGEMALVAKRRRSATATAIADTTLLVLSRANFEKLYKNATHIKINLELAIKSRQMARHMQFKWLRPDEVIYFLARKHSIVLWEKLSLPIAALILPLALFYIRLFYLPLMIFPLVGGLLLLLLAIWILWLWIDWSNDYYIVTNQRVVWLEKVIGIYDSRQESPIGTILSVGVESSRVGRFLDYGNVIVRTFVGKIPFNQVGHPEEAAKMVEEYWNRTKEYAAGVEKEAMKNAIRKRLGIPLPKMAPGFGEPAPLARPTLAPPKRSASAAAVLKFLGAESLKLRFESGERVVYRKHWVVLVLDAWISVVCMLGALGMFFARLVQLAYLPNERFISLQGGLTVDLWAAVFILTIFPFLVWFVYQVIDWSNDVFEVTNDQIIDIDRKPFGSETRNAAPLEGILGTFYERKGILGNLFNFGTVYITVGGSKLAFEDVMDPATVQSDIDRRRMARSAKKQEGQIAAERDRMAEWLATYHRSSEELRKEDEQNKRNQN